MYSVTAEIKAVRNMQMYLCVLSENDAHSEFVKNEYNGLLIYT